MTQALDLAEVFAGQNNTRLYEALTAQEARLAASPADQPARIARGWLITELQRRLPKARTHLERLIHEADLHYAATGEVTDVDYLGELAAFI